MNVFEVIALAGAALGGMYFGSRVAGELGGVVGLITGPVLLFALSWALWREKS
jgi:hypothetical protein